jgi:hypothetical protein
MSESITVVFSPVITVAGLTAFHETLVYTDSAGIQYSVSAGPQIGAGAAETSSGQGSNLAGDHEQGFGHQNAADEFIADSTISIRSATSITYSSVSPIIRSIGSRSCCPGTWSIG